ncbi:cation channel family protein (macronuclear) [Tetrahymena thermophila SB210]|uniref:Cation channel family protein n=1 Tax=Tetrahymena thermophila (strain SB210) TaxID=312017 RepID=I7LVX2_TETTS|nr:cation channel family protein [Tetrahymena thermophila SB210]EAS00272.2 cation channel family protein [Tetrahymena thermophila SB210]|eukprot:XP_001020517.2 cation channel family protein [Tetrahymena thermophila SB210]
MKQSLKQIDQSQRIYPLSPNESDLQFNAFQLEKGPNFIKKKMQNNNQFQIPQDFTPHQMDTNYNIFNQIQLSVNREYDKNEDMSNQDDVNQEKKKSKLIELIDQNSNKDDGSVSSQNSDKHKSDFVKKFEKVTWYKLIYLVSEAIQRWKSTLKAISIQYATQNQIEMIDDLSFFQTEQSKQRRIDYMHQKNKTVNYSQNKFIRRLKKSTRQVRKAFRDINMKIQDCLLFLDKRVEKILKNIKVFDPYDGIVLFWEILYMMLCLFLFVYLPFSVAFENERSLIIQGAGYVIIIIFLGIDILKNFNTAVYVKGELIKNHVQILKVYTYSLEFPLDVLTYFSAIGLLQFNYSRSIFLLRIFYKPSLIQKFKDAFQMSEKSIASVDLLKLFAIVLYLCHVVACVWYKLGEIQYEQSNSGWIVKNSYQNSDDYTLYVNSYFFAIIMMSSVKGNIQPSSNTEKIFTTLIAFGACVLFGYTITSITIILRNLNTKWDNFNLLVSQVTKFMRRYNVDPQQQQKARKYIEYVKDVSLEEKRKSQSILNCLSKQLKDEIFINIYSQQLLRIPFFKNYFSAECIEQLALKMQAIYYASDDPIITRQQINDPALYFVVEGQVIEYYFTNFELQNSLQEKVIRIKNKGDYVGLIEFITQNQRPLCYAKSKGVTELHMLKLKDFLDVVAKFPIEKEHYYHMKDQILINKKSQYIQIDCSLCYEKNHIERDCHFTFYEQRRKLFSQKYGVMPTTKKETILRKTVKLRYHSLSTQNQIQFEINNFLKCFTIKEHHHHHHHQDNHQINKYPDTNNPNNHMHTQQLHTNTNLQDRNGDFQHNQINNQNQVQHQNENDRNYNQKIELTKNSQAQQEFNSNFKVQPEKQQEQSEDDQKKDKKQLKQLKKEQKMISIMNQYNDDKQQDLQNLISVNFISPNASDTHRDLISNFVSYEQNDPLAFDQEDLVLLSPSVQDDHFNTQFNRHLSETPKQIQEKVNGKAAESITNQDQNKEEVFHSSSIQTFTPNNKIKQKVQKVNDTTISSSSNLNIMKNNYINDVNTPQNQNINQQQFQQIDLLHPNNIIRKQQSITYKSYEEIVQVNSSNNIKQVRQISNDGGQSKSNQQIQLQQQQQQQQFQKIQTSLQRQQSNLLNSIAAQQQDGKQTLNDLNESQVNQTELKLGIYSYYEQQNVSIDFSVYHNFQYYFPHNNLNYIFRVDKFKNKAKQRRSVMKPLLVSQNFIKKKTIKSQKSISSNIK